MTYEQNIVRFIYKKLVAFYPQTFREELGESMEQTFNDLYNAQKRQPARGFLMLSIFIETAIGIVREHLLILIEGNAMKNLLANPRGAAITSLILSLPLGLLFVIFNSDIELLTVPIKSLLTVNGSDVNVLGRIVLIGGLLLLPVAFVINLLPLLKRDRPEGERTLHVANLIVGLIILLIITVSWGALIVEKIYCLRGIRCD